MARVLIIEDEDAVRDDVAGVLRDAGHTVLTAANGADGLELAVQRSPDLVVLDLGLPDVHGLEVTRRLRRWTSAPVLILSGRDEEAMKVAALDAGADDYLQKPFHVQELLARVRAQLRRSHDTSVSVLGFGDLEVDLDARSVRRDGTDVRLTPTEWRLLRALATRPGALVTYPKLAREVWGIRDDNRPVVRAHVRTLRAKLGDDAAAPELIRTESGAGYRWIPRGGDDAGEDATGMTGGTGAGSTSATQGTPASSGRDLADLAHDLRNALTTVLLSARRAERLATGGYDDPRPSQLVESLRRCVHAAERANATVEHLETAAKSTVPSAGTDLRGGAGEPR